MHTAATLGVVAVSLWLGFAPAFIPQAWADESSIGRVVLETDFGASPQPVIVDDATGRDHASGELDPPWMDNSGWADVRIDYAAEREEGRRFTRLHLEEINRGWAQMMHPLPDLAEGVYTLTVTARNPASIPVTVGVRQRGEPYEFFWREPLPASGGFETHRFAFGLEGSRPAVGLYVLLHDEGVLDLASIELERISRSELEADLERRYPDGPPRNLAPVSRFPAGLPVGWTLGRYDTADVVSVASVPDSDAPTGGPRVLRVQSEEAFTIYSSPLYTPMRFDPHTLSFFARGEGRLRAELRAEGKVLARGVLNESGAFERFSLTFSPLLASSTATLVLSGHGSWRLDGLQLEPGTQATPLTPHRGEVALSTDALARVHFTDEPATVDLIAHGPADGARVRLAVVNAYDERRALEPIAFADRYEGEVGYAVFADRPLGSHRVEATVVDAEGQPLGPTAEIVVHRLPRPVFWGEDGDASFFGVHATSILRHLRMAKSVGVNWIRLHDAGAPYIGWYFLEPTPGQWRFRDAAIQRYRAEDLKILGVLATAPHWASHFERPAIEYFDRFYQPRDLNEFTHYVTTVAGRYREEIDAYEVWNEPWIEAWWAVRHDPSRGSDRAGYVTSDQPAADYVELTETARNAVASVDRSITILGLNSTTTEQSGSDRMSGREWTRRVLAAGGLDASDALSYHDYTASRVGFPEDAVQRGFDTAVGAALKQARRRGKTPPPVWMTEGQPARQLIGNGLYHHVLAIPDPPSEDVVATADRLVRYLTSVIAAGSEKVFLYSMHSAKSFDEPGDWRVLVSPDGQLHPSAAAHAVFARLVDGKRFDRAVDHGDATSFFFIADNGETTVVFIPRPGQAATPPLNGSRNAAIDLFGNPTRSERVTTPTFLLTEKVVGDLQKPKSDHGG